jgi:hypothetical protein
MLAGGDQDDVELSSSAPEDGRNYCPKHVELIEIINTIIIVASSWLFILLCYYYTSLIGKYL